MHDCLVIKWATDRSFHATIQTGNKVGEVNQRQTKRNGIQTYYVGGGGWIKQENKKQMWQERKERRIEVKRHQRMGLREREREIESERETDASGREPEKEKEVRGAAWGRRAAKETFFFAPSTAADAGSKRWSSAFLPSYSLSLSLSFFFFL
jgi:hypothetical protein